MPDKTPLQQVKQMLENDVTPKAILSWIESTGEAVERDAIVDAVEKGRYMKHETGLYVTGEQYYRTKYGETYH